VAKRKPASTVSSEESDRQLWPVLTGQIPVLEIVASSVSERKSASADVVLANLLSWESIVELAADFRFVPDR
jgi:hypothetical protein